MHKKRQWFVMEVSKQFKWALVTPHLYILFCQKVSSSEDTSFYCNSSHIKSDGRNGTCTGPTVVEVDTSTYLRLFWLLISTRINFFHVDQLEILKHEQNVDGLNGCFSLPFWQIRHRCCGSCPAPTDKDVLSWTLLKWYMKSLCHANWIHRKFVWIWQ